MKNITLITSIILLLNTVASFSQIGLYEVPLEQQINQSRLIVEGKVISKKSFWDEDFKKIYTVNTIEVFKSFKGEANNTIEVITIGGTVGDIGLTVSHHLELSENEVGIFTLTNSDVKLLGYSGDNVKYKVYSSMQGFYKYDEISNKVGNVFRSYDDIENDFYESIKKVTRKNFTEIKSRNNTLKTAISSKLPPFINNFSPTTASAGTGETITITGFTFGTTQGKVQFSDGNNGGTSFIDALDSEVTNWTNTSITVKVPSRAGTGVIRVVDALGAGNTSSGALTVPYAVLNSNGNVRQHYNTNESGGYTWQMSSDFNNDVSKAPFLRAFNTWICGTGVNWSISANTTFASAFARDGINLVAYDTPGDELPSGVLAAALGWTSSCATGTVIDEIDFIFDNERTNWHYGLENAPPGQIDFETVALHELGHGHALAHVISPGSLMHFSVSSGVTVRTLGASDLNGGNFVHNVSITNPQCGRSLMTSISCPSLSLNGSILNEAIEVFPNPNKGMFFIKNNVSVNLEKACIYDMNGRRIADYDLRNSSGSHTIDLSKASKGIYFVNIHSDASVITKKVVVE